MKELKAQTMGWFLPVSSIIRFNISETVMFATIGESQIKHFRIISQLPYCLQMTNGRIAIIA